ncbi:MAG: helix-turn-helix transcriptional regulator [Acidothermales bacterium]|nr:helix-turn-helix transcriptional regulator [Acidothermales bacterium]
MVDDCRAPLVSEPLGEPEASAVAPLLKALGDPVRLRLVSLIACHEGGEACVCELTGAFELTAPTISHHLKVLREAGVIDAERRGTWIFYRINADVLARISTLLAARAPVPA